MLKRKTVAPVSIPLCEYGDVNCSSVFNGVYCRTTTNTFADPNVHLPHNASDSATAQLAGSLSSQNLRGVRLTTWEEQCTAPYMEVMGLHRGELQESGCFSTTVCAFVQALHWPVHLLQGAWLGVEEAG